MGVPQGWRLDVNAGSGRWNGKRKRCGDPEGAFTPCTPRDQGDGTRLVGYRTVYSGGGFLSADGTLIQSPLGEPVYEWAPVQLGLFETMVI